MGNFGWNKVSHEKDNSNLKNDNFTIDFSIIRNKSLNNKLLINNFVKITIKEDANLKIVSGNGEIYYIKYQIDNINNITLGMILQLPIEHNLTKKCYLGNKFKKLLDINNSTLLSDYILKAKSYNMFKNNILYLPIL